MSEQRIGYATEPVQPVQSRRRVRWRLYHDGRWVEFYNREEMVSVLLGLLDAQQPTMTETYRVERVR